VLVALAAAAAALTLPGAAFAHGKTAPVATDFSARISAFRPPAPGVEAKVVDGDQALWLRVARGTTVLVPGVLGEPMLRFDAHGVWLNLRSLTAQSDRIDRYDLRPSTSPAAAPLWHRLTGGRSYGWHEHRLHLLQVLARGRRSAGALGPWSVPLVVDGRKVALDGTLFFRPPPLGWVWIGAACLLAVALAAATLLSGTQWAARCAVGATPVIWAVRIGRELYGRPTVGVIGYLSIALTSVVGLAFLVGLLHRDREVRLFTAFFVGFGSLYEGLTMLPVLTHATALSALPSTLVRVCIVVFFALGTGALVGSCAVGLRERVRHLGGRPALA
jgi:hypothetical protein